MIPVFPSQLVKGIVTLSKPIFPPDRVLQFLPVLETLPGANKEVLLTVLKDLLDRGVAAGHRVAFSPLSKWPTAQWRHPAKRWYFGEEVAYVPEAMGNAVYSGTIYTQPEDPFYKAICYLPDKTAPDEFGSTVCLLTTPVTQCRKTAEAFAEILYKQRVIAGARLLSSSDGGSTWEPAALTMHDDYSRFTGHPVQPGDHHTKLAAWLYGLPLDLVTTEQRLYAKGLSLANSYT